jgi:hypothetical protein
MTHGQRSHFVFGGLQSSSAVRFTRCRLFISIRSDLHVVKGREGEHTGIWPSVINKTLGCKSAERAFGDQSRAKQQTRVQSHARK